MKYLVEVTIFSLNVKRERDLFVNVMKFDNLQHTVSKTVCKKKMKFKIYKVMLVFQIVSLST